MKTDWKTIDVSKVDWSHVIYVYFDKPERLQALQHIYKYIPLEQLYKIFAGVWINLESHYQDKEIIENFFNILGNDPAKLRNAMMEPEEKSAFQKLKLLSNNLKIYRGCWANNKHGYSWTTDLAVAERFAKRHAPDGLPLIVEGKVEFDDVIAYFTGRQEKEIVIDPKKVKNKKLIRLPFQQVSQSKLLYQLVQSGNLFGTEHEKEKMLMMARIQPESYLAWNNERMEFFERFNFTSKYELLKSVKEQIEKELPNLPKLDTSTFSM